VKLFDRTVRRDKSTLDLIYDDSGSDLVCTTTLQTVTPFKLWPHLMVKIQLEIGNSRIRDVEG
jgi:hypothetical protein